MTLKNLSFCKNDVIDYVDSGAYDADIQGAIDDFKSKIDLMLGTTNLTVCFDIDDTAIRLEAYWRSKDYAGTNETITESQMRENEPANKIILDFYNYCISKGILCIFLTGRREKYLAYTEELLANALYSNYHLLDMKPTDSNLDDATFKAQQIDKYTAQGLIVGGVVGDQVSDFQNSAIYKCEIPNYWYDVTAYNNTFKKYEEQLIYAAKERLSKCKI
jgi:hypothetical protein